MGPAMATVLLSRDAPSHPSLVLHAVRKPFPKPHSKKWREAKRRKAPLHRPHQRVRRAPRGNGRYHPSALRARSPFGAPPRLSPAARKPPAQLQAMLPGTRHQAGVTRLSPVPVQGLHLPAGRSTGVNDARSRPGAGRNAARRHRPRSTFESTLAKGPSVNEMEGDVIDMVTTCQGRVPIKETTQRFMVQTSKIPRLYSQIAQPNFRFAAGSGPAPTPASCPLRAITGRPVRQ